MDYSQSMLGLSHYEDLTLTVSNGFSLPSPFKPSEVTGYTKSQIALLLIPSAVLLLLFPIRVIQLGRANLKVLPNYTGAIKVVFTIAIASLHLAALVISLVSPRHPDGSTTSVHVVSFVTALAVCQLSFFEHGRSVKPSTLLIFYLLATVICEGVLLQSLYFDHRASVILPILTAELGLNFAFLILESTNKRSYLREPYKQLAIGEVVSDLNRAFIFWVNDLIILGNSKLLTYSDLPRLDESLNSEQIRQSIEVAWNKTPKPEPREGSESGKALLWTLFGFFKGTLFLNAIPRLMVIAFRYSQPILISSTIKYVTQPVTEFEGQETTGDRLILAAFIIYVGNGVSFCIYQQIHNRIKVQTRGALVGLIHARCLTMRDGIYDDAAAVTHMSNDTDNVILFPWLCIEVFAQMLEVLIGMALLWNQLGWWCLTPLVIVAMFTQLAKWIGSKVGKSIGDWQNAKQKRIALTTSMIAHIKNIKLMGMTDTVMARVQSSRMNDIRKGIDFRWIIIYFNLAGI